MGISQMDINRIRERANLYIESQQAIEKRRKDWVEHTKPLLLENLKILEKEVALDWSVGTFEHKVNLQSIYLTFPNKESGIPMLKEKGEAQHIKFGGYLCYSQSSNGKVHVWISYPTIEQIKDMEEIKVLGEYDPEAISQEMIVEDVEQFLLEMVRWENYHKEAIGFKLKSRAA
jgi:hypothetical protein